MTSTAQSTKLGWGIDAALAQRVILPKDIPAIKTGRGFAVAPQYTSAIILEPAST
ncbi:hypothetical protein [Sulfitobacter sp.]|uniref:hypothetical protein n=1 Tax=Sulfitobacter sp. TaxID=1903071 RepID=UPI003298C4A3